MCALNICSIWTHKVSKQYEPSKLVLQHKTTAKPHFSDISTHPHRNQTKAAQVLLIKSGHVFAGGSDNDSFCGYQIGGRKFHFKSVKTVGGKKLILISLNVKKLLSLPWTHPQLPHTVFGWDRSNSGHVYQGTLSKQSTSGWRKNKRKRFMTHSRKQFSIDVLLLYFPCWCCNLILTQYILSQSNEHYGHTPVPEWGCETRKCLISAGCRYGEIK